MNLGGELICTNEESLVTGGAAPRDGLYGKPSSRRGTSSLSQFGASLKPCLNEQRRQTILPRLVFGTKKVLNTSGKNNDSLSSGRRRPELGLISVLGRSSTRQHLRGLA